MVWPFTKSDGKADYTSLATGPSEEVQQSWIPQIFRSQPVVRPDRRWVPEDEANFLSRLTFWWVDSIIRLGNQKPLEAADLWDVTEGDSAEYVSAQIEEAWAAELRRSKPSLVRALWRCFGLKFSLAGIIKLIHDLLQFMSPVMLKFIMQSLQDPSAPPQQGVLYVCLLLLCNVLQSICIHNYFHQVYRTSIRIRVALISVLYNKSLRISAASRQTTSVGQIVNLQSNDAEKIASLCVFLHILWSGPFQIIGALFLLFAIVGVIPAMTGFAVMLLGFPLNAFMAKALTAVRKRLVLATDGRVKLISEMVNGMKAIKLYAWEQPFTDKVEALRGKEMKEIKTTVVLSSVQRFVMGLNTLLVSMTSLATFTYLGHALTAAVAFPALSLFNMLQFPLAVLPRLINNAVQAGVAVDRIQKFLGLPESCQVASRDGAGVGSVSVAGGSFTWKTEEELEEGRKKRKEEKEKGGEGKAEEGGEAEEAEEDAVLDTLRNVDLEVQPGELLMVIGEVGSGKSSLLAALMGEIRKTAGSVHVNGQLAYTAQDPWIQNVTLRDNILMGRQLDQSRYDRVLDVCALREDLKTLPAGDQTEIGEKGINLSGGQKHRVALARALYSHADIYLLDDPLSAVDAHVGRHLFRECIAGELCGATRVLVTHQVQYASQADRIAVVSHGRIQALGTYAQLLQQGVDLSHFQLAAQQQPIAEEQKEGADQSDEKAVKAAALPAAPATQEIAPAPSPKLPAPAPDPSASPAPAPASSRLVQKEHKAVGRVRTAVYWSYFRAWGGRSGFAAPLAVLFVFILAQAAKLGNDTWLAVWTEAVQKGTSSVWFFLGVYCATAVMSALLSLTRSLSLTFTSLAASRKLHAQLLRVTLRLPMSFFESQPSGRLVNRFTRDTEQADLNLPDTVLSFFIYAFQIVFAVGIIVYVTPLFFFPLLPVLFVYQSVQRIYLAASRELKRIDSVGRSPIFAHFGESIAGLTTIRAFGCQPAFEAENSRRIDASTRAYFASIASNRWLGMRSELLAAATVFGTALFCVVIGARSAGFAGLAITNALTITGYMTWIVRASSELETQMNSVERLLEYSTLPTEAPAESEEGRRPPKSWPDKGQIEAYGLSVRYRPDLDPVLREVSFSIRGGEKVGVCGRTGCGKSTLMLAIYRIMELDAGALFIDSVDVSKIGLRDLRSSLALVPQDPVLFSGTLRFNLDPFGETRGDGELWEALRQVDMAGFVGGLPEGLDMPLAEGGSNLSTGQRQLLCMARALLRRARILILDEATSNVDGATDAVIQATVRSAFRERTVLTIAHRLHTIIDSDRIMLLEGGQVAEMDTPAALLADPGSRFTGFVNNTMPKEAEALKIL